MSALLFDGWEGPLRTVVVGGLAYVAVVLLIRLSGKRSLSKMNAFDLVVTVALGSTLATILLDRAVPLVEGVVAFAVLIGAQHLVAWASSRSSAVRTVVKSRPRLLAWRGRILAEALREERVAEVEIHAAARRQGIGDLHEIEAVVLETDGTFSVVRHPGVLLSSVHGWEAPGE